jgi:hypothetical protein
MSISADYIRTSLQAVYGESVTAADIRAWCAMNGSNYQTVTNKLTDYKVGRGKWNLEVTKETVEELETTYNAPAALPAIEQNLIPQKDDSFVSFGNFADIKKIIKSVSPVSSTLRLSRVSRAMAKRFLSNKHVPNSDVNSSESTSR